MSAGEGGGVEAFFFLTWASLLWCQPLGDGGGGLGVEVIRRYFIVCVCVPVSVPGSGFV